MGSSYLQIVILIILLALLAFFSGAETALMSLSKIRVRHMVEEKIKGADLVEKLIQSPSKLLGTILVGSTVINISASALATALAIDLFGSRGVGIATGIMTVMVLVFGEITPKSLAAQNSENFSLKVIKPILFTVALLKPVVVVVTYITNIFIRLLGGKASKDRPFITEEELKTMVDVSEEEGVLEIEEKEMIFNVFEFGDLKVKEVMVQRTDVVAVDVEVSFNEIIEVFKEEQFSRIVVYEESVDEVVGILNVKDLFFLEEKENFDIRKYMREPFFTFEFKNVAELLREMKKARVHMSIVLDEYGGTAGIVTIEDMIEEIVGEIEDEYDELEQEIRVIKEDEYMVEGGTRIETVNEMIGINIESEDFDSIGGFIIGLLGRIPEDKEVIEYNGIRFTIESIEKNRIKKIRIIT